MTISSRKVEHRRYEQMHFNQELISCLTTRYFEDICVLGCGWSILQRPVSMRFRFTLRIRSCRRGPSYLFVIESHAEQVKFELERRKIEWEEISPRSTDCLSLWSLSFPLCVSTDQAPFREEVFEQGKLEPNVLLISHKTEGILEIEIPTSNPQGLVVSNIEAREIHHIESHFDPLR